MWLTKRRLRAELATLRADRERLREELDEAKRERRACASQLERHAHVLSVTKDVVAMHIVAAGHPSTVLHDPNAFATALRQSLSDAGVDISLELARMEGAVL